MQPLGFLRGPKMEDLGSCRYLPYITSKPLQSYKPDSGPIGRTKQTCRGPFLDPWSARIVSRFQANGPMWSLF